MEAYFSLREAEQLVPRLQRSFAEIRVYLDEMMELRTEPGRRASADLQYGGWKKRIAELERGLQRNLTQLRNRGLEVRRVDGLVDIPTMWNGRPAYYCWRFGDQGITHGHLRNVDCTSRRIVDRQKHTEEQNLLAWTTTQDLGSGFTAAQKP